MIEAEHFPLAQNCPLLVLDRGGNKSLATGKEGRGWIKPKSFRAHARWARKRGVGVDVGELPFFLAVSKEFMPSPPSVLSLSVYSSCLRNDSILNSDNKETSLAYLFYYGRLG